MTCGVGRRCSSDPALLWLWRRPVATALIRPLVWESPYATGAALEKAKRQKKKYIYIYIYIYINCTYLVFPVMLQLLTSPSRNHEVAGSIPGLAQWVNDLVLP